MHGTDMKISSFCINVIQTKRKFYFIDIADCNSVFQSLLSYLFFIFHEMQFK